MVFLGLDLFGFVVVTPPTMIDNLVCSTGFWLTVHDADGISLGILGVEV